MNQESQILEYMKEHGAISPMDALREFGCMRLGARIFDLRQLGYRIVTINRKGKNRNGHHTSWAEYRLEKRQ